MEARRLKFRMSALEAQLKKAQAKIKSLEANGGGICGASDKENVPVSTTTQTENVLKELKKREAELSSLQEDNKLLVEDLEKHRLSLQEHADLLQEAHMQVQESNRAKEMMSDNVEKHRLSLEEHATLLQEADAEIQQVGLMKQMLQEQKEEITACKMQQVAALKKCGELEELVRKVKQERCEFEIALQDATSGKTELLQQVSVMKEMQLSRENEIAELKRDIEQNQTEKDGFQMRLSEIEQLQKSSCEREVIAEQTLELQKMKISEMTESLVSKEAEQKEIAAQYDSVTIRLQNMKEKTSTAVSELTTEKAALLDRIKELEMHLQQKDQVIYSRETKEQEIQLELKHIADDAAEKKKTLDELAAEKQALLQQVQSLKQQNLEALQSCKSKVAEGEALQQSLKQAHQNTFILEQEIEKMTERAQSESELLMQTTEDKQSIEKLVEKMNREDEVMKGVVQELESDKEKLQQRVTDLEEQQVNLKNLKEIEEDKSLLQQQLNAMFEEGEMLQRTLKEVEKDKQCLQQTVVEMTERVEKTLKEVEVEKHSSQQKVGEISEERERIQKILENVETEKRVLQEKVGEISEEGESAQQILKEVEAEKQFFQQKVEEVSDENERFQNSLKESEDEKDRLQQRVDDISGELKILQKTQIDLEADKQLLQKKVDETFEEAEMFQMNLKEISAEKICLQQKLENMSEADETIQRTLKEVEGQKQLLQQNFDDMSEENQKIQQNLKELLAEKEKHQQEIDQLTEAKSLEANEQELHQEQIMRELVQERDSLKQSLNDAAEQSLNEEMKRKVREAQIEAVVRNLEDLAFQKQQQDQLKDEAASALALQIESLEKELASNMNKLCLAAKHNAELKEELQFARAQESNIEVISLPCELAHTKEKLQQFQTEAEFNKVLIERLTNEQQELVKQCCSHQNQVELDAAKIIHLQNDLRETSESQQRLVVELEGLRSKVGREQQDRDLQQQQQVEAGIVIQRRMEEVEAALDQKNQELKQTNLMLQDRQQALAEAKEKLDENLQRLQHLEIAVSDGEQKALEYQRLPQEAGADGGFCTADAKLRVAEAELLAEESIAELFAMQEHIKMLAAAFERSQVRQTALQSELGLSCERLNVLERMLAQTESESEEKDYKLVQRRPHAAQQLERLLLKLTASQEFAQRHAAEKRQMQTTIETNRKLADGVEKSHRLQLQELQHVVEQFKEKLEQLEGEREMLERELETQQAQQAELHVRDHERNNELSAVREALTEAEQNKLRLSEELEERQRQLRAQKQDTNNLVEQLQQTQQELILEMDQSWSSQLEQMKNELATCQHQFGEEKHKLLNDLTRSQQRGKLLEQKSDELELLLQAKDELELRLLSQQEQMQTSETERLRCELVLQNSIESLEEQLQLKKRELDQQLLQIETLENAAVQERELRENDADNQKTAALRIHELEDELERKAEHAAVQERELRENDAENRKTAALRIRELEHELERKAEHAAVQERELRENDAENRKTTALRIRELEDELQRKAEHAAVQERELKETEAENQKTAALRIRELEDELARKAEHAAVQERELKETDTENQKTAALRIRELEDELQRQAEHAAVQERELKETEAENRKTSALRIRQLEDELQRKADDFELVKCELEKCKQSSSNISQEELNKLEMTMGELLAKSRKTQKQVRILEAKNSMLQKKLNQK